MKIVSADITGSLILNGVDVTTNVVSSSIFSGSIAGRVTSLEQFSASLDATFATDASVSASILVLSQSVQNSQAALSSSYALTSGSYAASSASLSTRVTNLESTSSIVSSSFATTSGSIAGRVTLIEGQYATTGSNVFSGTQRITEASNAISFTSTASLYTDGGLRVSKDSYVSGTAYFNNITVYGTSSIQYITSSQVDVGTNIITVNTDTPAVRFGGLAVFDSGSTQLTGSMLWDSERNHWVYSNPSGSSYSGGMIMSGPRSSALGDEQGTLNNYVMKGQGGDHITSSQIIDDGTTVRIPGALQVTGSLYALNLTGSLNGSNLVDASVANAKLTNSTISGIALGSNLATLTIGTGLSGTSYNGSTGITIANTITNNNQLTNGAGYITSAGTAAAVSQTITAGSESNLVSATIGTNDFFRIRGGGSSNAGFVEIATADDGTEPIYLRQYTGEFASITRTATLLDGSGNTSFPGTVSATFSGNITGAVTGTASGNVVVRGQSNWNDSTIISNVVGMLAWKNYGNGHVIFDASQGTSPSGTSINNTNPNAANWSPTYPTLMGWNGSGTYGVRVDTARYAETSATVTGTSTISGKLTISNGASNALQIDTDVADNNTRDAIYLYENSGQASGRQAISWYNGSGGGTPYYKARLWTEVGAGYNVTQFGIDVANNARTLATRLYINNGDTYCSGDVVAYASDFRLKENIRPIENALSKVQKISGVHYEWKDKVKELGFEPTTKQDIGVIAQAIQEVLPEAVKPAPFDYVGGTSKSGENYLTVQYEKIVPLLIEAIKEQQTQIEELKSIINGLTK